MYTPHDRCNLYSFLDSFIIHDIATVSILEFELLYIIIFNYYALIMHHTYMHIHCSIQLHASERSAIS